MKSNNKRRLGVILLSGGLDSTTVAAYAKMQGYELAALALQRSYVLGKARTDLRSNENEL